jgi:Tfp pilus assembly protein PilN
MSRLLVMSIAVLVLTTAVIGWEIISTNRAKVEAERQLAEQQQKAKELEVILKEKQELEARIKNIDLRIDAIKKLRSTQAGPSAVLEALRERIGMTPNVYLDSVEQKGDQITIKGSSPVEASVTQFGRSLEFSSGLFSNLSIETQRKEAGSQNASAESGSGAEIIEFTIRCAYTPEKAGSKEGNPTTASNMQQPPNGQTDQSGSAPPQPKSENSKPPQVAQNQDN